MPYFRIARDPTAAALADPYLGQSIGPVPGYGVSFCVMFISILITFHKTKYRQNSFHKVVFYIEKDKNLYMMYENIFLTLGILI